MDWRPGAEPDAVRWLHQSMPELRRDPLIMRSLAGVCHAGSIDWPGHASPRPSSLGETKMQRGSGRHLTCRHVATTRTNTTFLCDSVSIAFDAPGRFDTFAVRPSYNHLAYDLHSRFCCPAHGIACVSCGSCCPRARWTSWSAAGEGPLFSVLDGGHHCQLSDGGRHRDL